MKRIIKKYWHVYMLVLVWCVYDGISLKYGFNHPTNSVWHIGMLLFVFQSISKDLPKQKELNVSFISFLIVILIKIFLNLIAAFKVEFREYNSVLNNAYMDFGVLVFIMLVHFYIGFKEWRA